MNGTGNNSGQATPWAVAYDRHSDMAAFDSLPPSLREAMRNAPVNSAAVPAAIFVTRFGADLAEQVFRANVQALHPGYVPPVARKVNRAAHDRRPMDVSEGRASRFGSVKR
jgi:hypothetical protein